MILPNDHLETPHFEVQRLRDDSPDLQTPLSSYEMTTVEVEEAQPAAATRTLARQEAAVKTAPERTAAPAPAPITEAPAAPVAHAASSEPSLFKGLVKSLVSLFASKEEAPALVIENQPSNAHRAAKSSAVTVASKLAAVVVVAVATKSASRAKSVSLVKNAPPVNHANPVKSANRASRVKSVNHVKW